MEASMDFSSNKVAMQPSLKDATRHSYIGTCSQCGNGTVLLNFGVGVEFCTGCHRAVKDPGGSFSIKGRHVSWMIVLNRSPRNESCLVSAMIFPAIPGDDAPKESLEMAIGSPGIGLFYRKKIFYADTYEEARALAENWVREEKNRIENPIDNLLLVEKTGSGGGKDQNNNSEIPLGEIPLYDRQRVGREAKSEFSVAPIATEAEKISAEDRGGTMSKKEIMSGISADVLAAALAGAADGAAAGAADAAVWTLRKIAGSRWPTILDSAAGKILTPAVAVLALLLIAGAVEIFGPERRRSSAAKVRKILTRAVRGVVATAARDLTRAILPLAEEAIALFQAFAADDDESVNTAPAGLPERSYSFEDLRDLFVPNKTEVETETEATKPENSASVE